MAPFSPYKILNKGLIEVRLEFIPQPFLRRICFPAVRADAAHQALGNNQVDRRGDQIGLKPDIQKARDGRNGIIGMQGRKNQMPR